MMRRLLLLAITGALMVALTTTAAFAQRSPESPGPDETFMGTEESEVLFGTNDNDLIEGLGGHDYLNGLWGNEVLHGAAEGKPSAGHMTLSLARPVVIV